MKVHSKISILSAVTFLALTTSALGDVPGLSRLREVQAQLDTKTREMEKLDKKLKRNERGIFRRSQEWYDNTDNRRDALAVEVVRLREKKGALLERYPDLYPYAENYGSTYRSKDDDHYTHNDPVRYDDSSRTTVTYVASGDRIPSGNQGSGAVPKTGAGCPIGYYDFGTECVPADQVSDDPSACECPKGTTGCPNGKQGDGTQGGTQGKGPQGTVKTCTPPAVLDVATNECVTPAPKTCKADEEWDDLTEECVKVQKPIEEVEPKKYVRTPKQCKDWGKVPNMGAEGGTLCVKPSPKTCVYGVSDDGKSCKSDPKLKKTLVCKGGLVLSADKTKCEKPKEEPKKLVCDPSKDEVLSADGKSCVIVKKEEPKPLQCEAGSVPSADGKLCVAVERPQPKCGTQGGTQGAKCSISPEAKCAELGLLLDLATNQCVAKEEPKKEEPTVARESDDELGDVTVSGRGRKKIVVRSNGQMVRVPGGALRKGQFKTTLKLKSRYKDVSPELAEMLEGGEGSEVATYLQKYLKEGAPKQEGDGSTVINNTIITNVAQ